MKQNKKLVLAVTAAVLGATSLTSAINPVVIGPEGIQFSKDTSAGKGIDVDTKGGVIAFDSNTTANTVSSTDNAKTGEPGNFVVGQSNTVETTDDSTSVFGNQNYVKGANANAYGDGNIAIGTTTQAFGDNNLTQGNYAVNYGIDNIVGGAFTNEELVQDRRPINTSDAADKSVAMGRANVITGSTNAIAIGTSNSIGTTDDVSDSSTITTKNAADNAVVLGTENKTLATNSIVIGQKNELVGSGDYEAKKAIAIGYQITAAASESIGIGDGASAFKTNTVAIGKGTSAGAAEGDVALGAESETTAVVATKEASITSGKTTIKYGDFAGNAPTSAVSIGKAGAERQLQNVAAGQITDKSTDAINGSQLYATNTVVANLAETTAQGFGGTSKVDDKGNVTVGLTVGDKNFTNVQDALNSVNDAAGNYSWIATAQDGANGAKEESIKSGTKVTYAAGKNMEVVQNGTTFTYQTADKVTFSDVTSDTATIGGNTTITKDGINTNKVTAETVKAGGVTADTATIGDNTTINKDGINTNKVTAGDVNATTATIGDNTTITKDGIETNKVTAGDVKADTATIGDNTTINKDGIDTNKVTADTAKIGKVTIDNDGTISGVATATEGNQAVNLDQLTNTIANSSWNATAAGNVVGNTSIAKVTPNTTVTYSAGKNMEIVQDNSTFTYRTASEVEFDKVTTKDLSADTISGKTATITDGATIGENTTITKDGGVKTNTVTTKELTADTGKIADTSITKDGIDNGGHKITNVGDGEIKDGSKDAINGSQLYNELQKVVAGATTINVTANGEGSQSITNHSTLDFVDGTGTKATVTPGKDGVTTVSYSVDKDALTGKIDSDNGKVTASKDGFATTGDVADAINKSGFYVDGGKKTFVKNGDTVKFDAGSNLTRSQVGDTITYALSDDLSGLKSIETKTATIETATIEKATIGGNTTISKDGITTNNVTATGTIAGKTIKGDTVTTKELIADAGKIGGVTIDNSGRISGVADGQKDSDAVNYGQLSDVNAKVNNRIDNLGDRMNKAVAGTAALAALHPLDFNPDDKWSFAAGYGNYRGANAAAVGAYYQPNEDLLLSVGSSMGNGENVLNAGLSFKLGRGQHVNTTRVAMAKEIIDLRKENKNLKDRLDRLEERMNNPFGSLDMSKKVDFPDVPANHWAYQYVATLAGNGIIEGYPDNTYKGQQNITRYEMAALFYRALQNGAPIDDNMNKGLIEFSPELQDIAASRVRVDRVSGKDNDRHKVERAHVNNEDRKIKDIYGSNIKTK